MALPILILSALNMEINAKPAALGITKCHLISIVGAELLIIVFSHLSYLALTDKATAFLTFSLLVVLGATIALSALAKKYSLAIEAVYYSLLAGVLCFIYPFLYFLIAASDAEYGVTWRGLLGIILPAIFILFAPFIKGKLGIKILALAIFLSPIALTFDLRKPHLLPKIVVKSTRQGSFFVEKLVLDKKGCQIVSNNPARECVADTYYVCAAYVDSRLGDPNLIRVLRYNHMGTADTKVYEIPSTSVLGMSMDKEQRLLDGDDIDLQLEKLAKRCMMPTRFVIDGLFSLKQKDLDENGRRRVLEAVDNLLTSGAQPPLRILGYADESGSESENLALSQKRAAAVRDYLVSAGYPVTLITLSPESDSKPIQQCKKKTVQGKYDCGRVNRRVEIEVHNF